MGLEGGGGGGGNVIVRCGAGFSAEVPEGLHGEDGTRGYVVPCESEG